METLTVQKIESSNSLFDHYLKRALFWDESKEFAPNGLTKKDFDKETEAYGLYDDDCFVGFSLVKFDANGNVVTLKYVVDGLRNNNQQLSAYLDNYMENVVEGQNQALDSSPYVKKMKRY